MAPPRIVLIPGMGADHRLFDGLSLAGHEVLRTDWIAHRASDDLAVFARRFAAHHAITADDILVGVSMGGMVAAAIADVIPVRRVVLVSSGTDPRHLAPWLSVGARIICLLPFGCLRWLPMRLVPIRHRLVVGMLRDMDPGFIRWACRELPRWPGVPRADGAVTIHGTADPLFPIRRQPRVDLAIAGGGHFMILDRAAEIEAAIAGAAGGA